MNIELPGKVVDYNGAPAQVAKALIAVPLCQTWKINAMQGGQMI